jgi:hypothetical protein
MQAIKEKAQVFLRVFLATHNGCTVPVLLEGAVDEFGGKGLPDTGLKSHLLPVLDFALLNHGEFIYKVNPNERRKKEKKKEEKAWATCGGQREDWKKGSYMVSRTGVFLEEVRVSESIWRRRWKSGSEKRRGWRMTCMKHMLPWLTMPLGWMKEGSKVSWKLRTDSASPFFFFFDETLWKSAYGERGD